MATTRHAAARICLISRRGLLAAGLGLLIAACGTGTATPTAAPTAMATVAAATATPNPTAAPTPTASPTAPGRLCTGAEQVAAVTIWHVVPGGTEIDFLTGSHSSTSGGTPCYLRGTAEGQVVAGGAVIADSGAATATVADSDPYVLETPGDKIYSSVLWSNWCGRAPAQPITVAFVLPGFLGRAVVANNNSGMPAPPCVSSGSPSTVTPTSAWQH